MATATSLAMVAAPPSVMSLLGEGDHSVGGAAAISPGGRRHGRSTNFFVERGRETGPCGVGVAFVSADVLFSSLEKNQRLYSSLVSISFANLLLEFVPVYHTYKV
jgi:hypothetical protein